MTLYGVQTNDRMQFDVLRLYSTGEQSFPLVVPADAPREVRELARTSRINLIAIVISSLVESLFLDNIRPSQRPIDEALPAGTSPTLDVPEDPDDVIQPIWKTLQKNRFDRRQGGLYRAVFQYGVGYVVVTPGQPEPVVRPMSPRKFSAMYDDDLPDYPQIALEKRSNGSYRLYEATDGEAVVHNLGYQKKGDSGSLYRLDDEPQRLGISYVPVIKYVDTDDLDLDDEPISQALRGAQGNSTDFVAGQVAPLMTLQDQTDISSFALKSAEWYTAFRQRWIKGWTPANRSEKMRMGASQVWSFEDAPDDIELGEFSETSLDGFLRSRESVLKYAATLSQTPVHELIGELVNLSAEALAAAEAGRDRKVGLAKVCLGESHEQLAETIGAYKGIDVPEDIEVVWKDTSARAFAAVIDGLGKVAQMLQVPPEMLWDRIPGVTRQDVQRWKAAARQGDSLATLTKMLEGQAGEPAATGLPAGSGETRTDSGLILPPGVRA